MPSFDLHFMKREFVSLHFMKREFDLELNLVFPLLDYLQNWLLQLHINLNFWSYQLFFVKLFIFLDTFEGCFALDFNCGFGSSRLTPNICRYCLVCSKSTELCRKWILQGSSCHELPCFQIFYFRIVCY